MKAWLKHEGNKAYWMIKRKLCNFMLGCAKKYRRIRKNIIIYVKIFLEKRLTFKDCKPRMGGLIVMKFTQRTLHKIKVLVF